MTALAELRTSRELLVNLTQREVKGKYKRTALGQGWSLLNPLATMAVFTVVFSVFFRIQPDVGDPSGLDNFALFLLCGLLPWTFFSNAMTAGMGSLLANGNLIQKVYFPREVLVAATVFSFDVSFVIELGVVAVVIGAVGGVGIIPFIPLVPVYMLLLTMFGLGFALALSVANVYFRDTSQFLGILIQIWFYLTPIVYPPSLIKPDTAVVGINVHAVEQWNPAARYVECFRNLLYDHRIPSLGDSLYVAAAAVISLAIGYAIFTRFDGRLAEEL